MLPRFDPLSVESSSDSRHDIWVRMHLARLQLEEERERKFQLHCSENEGAGAKS